MSAPQCFNRVAPENPFHLIPQAALQPGTQHPRHPVLQRQADGERQPHAFVARQVDFPAVLAHDSPHDEQPQPGAARFRREVRIEDLRHVFRRNASSGVGEADGNKLILQIRADFAAVHRLSSPETRS